MVAVVRQVQYLSPSLHGVLAEANMAFVGRDGSQLFVVVLGNSMHDVTFLRSWLDLHLLVRCQFHQLLVGFPSQPGQLVCHGLREALLGLGDHFLLRQLGTTWEAHPPGHTQDSQTAPGRTLHAFLTAH